MDLQDRVGMVVVVGQQGLDLVILELLTDIQIFLIQQFEKIAVIVLAEIVQIIQQPRDRFFINVILVPQILERVILLDDALRFLLIVPEVFRILLFFQLFDSVL
jgi:hypothetical protein